MKYVVFLVFALVLLFIAVIPHIEDEPQQTLFDPVIIDLEETAIDEGKVADAGEKEKNESGAPETSFNNEPAQPAPVITEATTPTVPFTLINTQAREALVNILCTTKSSGPFSPTTGSGIMLDARGVILTNAHLGQYFLLKDYLTKDFVECVIRIGSPAKPVYRAELLYIPQAWVMENATSIANQNPTGTGEDDYALLLIKEHVQQSLALPSSFSSVQFDASEGYIQSGSPILIASYPAGFLSGQIVQKDLYALSTITYIGELFTFATTTLDVFSTGGNVAAQKGSSGGAVIGNHNKLIGLITLSTEGDTTAERDLRAITLAHINRSLIAHTGKTLETFLAGNLVEAAASFNTTTVPILTKLLTDALEK